MVTHKSLFRQLQEQWDNALALHWQIRTLADDLERKKNLLNWTHPKKTGMIVSGMLVCLLFMTFMPLKWFVFWAINGAFGSACLDWYEAYKSKKSNALETGDEDSSDTISQGRLYNMIDSVPTDLDLEEVFHFRHDRYQKRGEILRIEAGMGSLWAGVIHKYRTRGSFYRPRWETRFLIVKHGGMLVWWRTRKAAVAGQRPKHFFINPNLQFKTLEDQEQQDDMNVCLCVRVGVIAD